MGKGLGNMACRHRTVMVFGIVQLIFGLGIFVCGILLITSKSVVAPTYHGLWGGIFVMLTGAIGLAGGLTKKRGLEIAFMVLSIIEAVCMWIGLIFISMAGAVLDAFITRKERYDGLADEDKVKCAADSVKRIAETSTNINYPTDGEWVLCTNATAASSNFAIMILSGILLVVAVVSASMVCCAVCRCCGARRDDEVAPQQAVYG